MGSPPGSRGPRSGTSEPPGTARLLDLEPHPEGGWYRQTWASDRYFSPAGYHGERASCTAIYFLLEPGQESRWHRVRSPELWLWHRGAPLVLQLGGTGETPDPDPRTVVLGPDIAAGQRPQVLVPADEWQSGRPAADDEVLVSCVVSPGFDFADFTMLS
ncbi:cupin domain-containing protein [Planosporangium thailandense]|uniref:Cupin domain-containing protein n=1 Tax=Planosporangium thailandense TaxID=765197 RepID=A0ABX0Y3P1_9ACTN|nr:cupin domain-containing protein [Planosporangium thailandense]NJC72042.1 cupin domain-containing protein [Planosporangium thailandense]